MFLYTFIPILNLKLIYRSYLTRLSLYKRKCWTCESTGKSDLTFEDALRSELNARKEVMDLFPETWISQMLALIHHSTFIPLKVF